MPGSSANLNDFMEKLPSWRFGQIRRDRMKRTGLPSSGGIAEDVKTHLAILFRRRTAEVSEHCRMCVGDTDGDIQQTFARSKLDCVAAKGGAAMVVVRSVSSLTNDLDQMS